MLAASSIETPIGPMQAIADDQHLYLLEFNVENRIARGKKHLEQALQKTISPGKTRIIQKITQELGAYFSGTLKAFTTPFSLLGSPFQQKVWQALQTIPAGQTRSYLDIAQAIHQSSAYRAVANANGRNLLAIIIPCHRVINHNGKLGGYGGGLERKAWLIAHEKQYLQIQHQVTTHA